MQTFCCPTSYSLYNVDFDKPMFPSQCISTLTDGQTLSYRTVSTFADGSATNAPTSTVVDGDTITIYGIPVNGLNVVSPTSSPSSASATGTTSTSAGEGGTITASANASSAAQSNSSAGGAHASVVRVAVGASVGAVAGLLFLAACVSLLWRRKTKGPLSPGSGPALEMDAPPGGPRKSLKSSSIGSPNSNMSSKCAAELDSGSHHVAYELPADTRSGHDGVVAQSSGGL